MSKKTKRKKTYRYYRRRRLKKRSLRSYLGSRLVEISIILIALFVVIYAFSFFTKLNQPTSDRQGDLVLARTQILNACPKKEAAQRVTERLKRMKVNNIAYQIIETSDLRDFEPQESLVLDRLGDRKKETPSEVARLTAQALGIRPQNVIYKALEDNYQGISLTIVIGSDWKVLFPDT